MSATKIYITFTRMHNTKGITNHAEHTKYLATRRKHGDFDSNTYTSPASKHLITPN
jgi:hypothetical protein